MICFVYRTFLIVPYIEHCYSAVMRIRQTRTARALGAAVKARRQELGWSQAQLAEQLGVQRQWVIRLEAGGEGAELGTVLRALTALGLSIAIGSEPGSASEGSAPAANLDEVFARLQRPRQGFQSPADAKRRGKR